MVSCSRSLSRDFPPKWSIPFLFYSMGDGVTFPQRHMDEDEDSLLGARSQRWMEEGSIENTRLETNPYRKSFESLQFVCLH